MFNDDFRKRAYYFLKRIIDIFGSIFLLILFFPIMLITAIAIKLTSEGPVFADIPMRVGKDGKKFKLYKFRSMIVNAHVLMKTDPKFKKLYKKYKESSYKISINEDPRITTVGRFIRKYSIDEMPQFINVLRGEMSIVGPRAYYPDELKEQQKKYPHTKALVKKVLKVKPGITGYWQVSGRNEVNFDKRIEMDAYYAQKCSIFFDIWIMLKTPWVMISGKGAL
ncbi:MAG: sugar transferase [Patescibacteria group bacterium]|nr:sugar transferase [Patescibacteria group bacterium]